MPFSTDNILPAGGLNADMDLALVPKGDYTDALNIIHISQQGQTGFAIQNTLGNKYRFTIPATVAQDKQYRILMQISSGTLARQITIFDANGNSIAVVGWVDNATTIATSYSNFTTALATAMGAASPAQTYTISALGANNYTIFTLTTITGLEYSIQDTQGTNTTSLDIIAEAWDASLTGDANIIGSRDILGTMWIYSTPQTHLTTTVPISAETNVSGSLIRITTTVAHGLVTGESVTISGCVGAGAASTNGIWIVTVIDFTHFDLQNSVWVSNTIGTLGIVSENVAGIGEIGVATYNPSADAWTYTTLLKSKELNFRTPFQIDAYGETNNFQTSNYFTDNQPGNPPRCFYYLNVPFITNGAILAIDSNGQYSYGSIASATRLIFSNSGAQFSFTGQLVGGGAIQSGNWRYAIRFLTATFGATNYSDLSNIVNVYAANQFGTGSAIYGDEPLVQTSKINNFQVTGIPTGVFSYVELVAINYAGGAVSGITVGQFAITGSSMTLQHTGSEVGVTNLDVTTLNQFSFDIETARNIEAIDNRLILSNLTTSQQTDFSAWAKTLTHSLKQQKITSIGQSSTGPNNFGEYQDPLNVYNYMGYALFETYRVMVKLIMRSSGSTTQCFWVDDIVINNSATNVTTPNRRVAGLPNLNLTPSIAADPSSVYVPYIEIGNINLDYLINGVPLRTLVSEIHFERVERGAQAEVLATGLITMSVDALPIVTTYYLGYKNNNVNGIGEYPEISGYGGSINNYPDTYATAYRNIVKMYSPDIFCGQTAINYEVGDVILSMGNGQVSNHIDVPKQGAQTSDSDITEYNGYFTSSKQSVSVLGVANAADGGSPITFSGNSSIYYQVLQTYNTFGPIVEYSWNNKGGVIIYTGNTPSVGFTTSGANADTGAYFAAYFRPIPYSNPADPTTSKYGNPALNVSVPTGTILQVPKTISAPTVLSITGATNATPIVITAASNTLTTGQTVVIAGVTGTVEANGIWQIVVLSPTTFQLVGSVGVNNYISGGTATTAYNQQAMFGGDVFTQKTYLYVRTTEQISNAGASGGIAFYSQNVVNSQMIFKNTPVNGAWDYPNLTPISWMSQTNFASSLAPYNTGYTYNNEVSSDSAFNPKLPSQQYLPTEIRWSDLKPQNAIVDNYRIFLPLNFFDLPMTFGPINGMANFNGELFTLQPRMVQRQYFNTRGTMNVGGGAATEVLIGDGSVMSRPGQLVTVIGTNNKWSIVKGKSDQGNDTLYWINTELKKVMRMGYDGTIKVSDIHGMQSFFANNLKWVNNVDTPAAGQGICGTWDDRYSCVLWSVMGKVQIGNGINVWASGTTYGANAVVQYTPSVFSTFEQTGEFYVSNSAANHGHEPDTNSLYWTLIPHVNPTDYVVVNGVTYVANQYYNEYTMEYNEQKNKFTTRYTFKPRIYLKWTDTFLTPMSSPSNNTGAIYEHRLGAYCTWYDTQVADAFLEMIYNQNLNTNKLFLAVWFNSLLVPARVDFYTANFETFLLNTDFVQNQAFWTAAIKNDILTSSDGNTTTQDTSKIFGQYVQIKLTLAQSSGFQKLLDFVLKFFTNNRNPLK